MTLKTFHHAGISSKSVTQGLPRVKELYSATPNEATPVMRVRGVAGQSDRDVASAVLGVTVGDVVRERPFVERCTAETPGWEARYCASYTGQPPPTDGVRMVLELDEWKMRSSNVTLRGVLQAAMRLLSRFAVTSTHSHETATPPIERRDDVSPVIRVYFAKLTFFQAQVSFAERN